MGGGAKKLFVSCFGCYSGVDADGRPRSSSRVKTRQCPSGVDSNGTALMKSAERERKMDMPCSLPKQKRFNPFRVSNSKDSARIPSGEVKQSSKSPAEDDGSSATRSRATSDVGSQTEEAEPATVAQTQANGGICEPDIATGPPCSRSPSESPWRFDRHSASDVTGEMLDKVQDLENRQYPMRDRALSCHPVLMQKFSFVSTVTQSSSSDDDDDDDEDGGESLSASDIE